MLGICNVYVVYSKCKHEVLHVNTDPRKSYYYCYILLLSTNKRYHNGLLDGLLYLHAFAGDGLIQFPLKGQEVHVSLGLRDQVSDLKSQQPKWVLWNYTEL